MVQDMQVPNELIAPLIGLTGVLVGVLLTYRLSIHGKKLEHNIKLSHEAEMERVALAKRLNVSIASFMEAQSRLIDYRIYSNGDLFFHERNRHIPPLLQEINSLTAEAELTFNKETIKAISEFNRRIHSWHEEFKNISHEGFDTQEYRSSSDLLEIEALATQSKDMLVNAVT